MGWLHFARRTGRARGHRNTSEIEADHGRFSLEATNGKQGGVRQPRHLIRENHSPRNPLQAGFQPIPQAFQARGIALEVGYGSLGRCSEPGNSRDVFSSGPLPPFLTAPAQLRFQPGKALGQDHRADPLGATDLVSRQSCEIGIQGLDIKSYFSKCLDRVDMQ